MGIIPTLLTRKLKLKMVMGYAGSHTAGHFAWGELKSTLTPVLFPPAALID